MIAKIGLCLVVVVIGLAIAVLCVLVYQGKRKPKGNAQYVALGSSFAAGIGLGPRAPGSPLICMRSSNGYPQQLARRLGLSLADMSCSGATAEHVLRGGQMFLGPQLAALGENTELVTMTIGGNDLRYVGDLSMMAGRKSSSVFGWMLRRFWKGPLPAEQRKYLELATRTTTILTDIRRRAPRAKIVVVTYPTILPPDNVCSNLALSDDEAASMRLVGDRLAEISRLAADAAGAIPVDMHCLGAAHHACSQTPWVNGWANAEGTQFHPTLAGATATAAAIAEVLHVYRQ